MKSYEGNDDGFQPKRSKMSEGRKEHYSEVKLKGNKKKEPTFVVDQQMNAGSGEKPFGTKFAFN